MRVHFKERPNWTLPQKLALAARILASEGHDSGIAGQITARGNQPNTMWTASFGLGLDEICATVSKYREDSVGVYLNCFGV